LTWLLDSCVAIDLRDSRRDMVAKVTALPTRPCISAITKVELEGGVYSNPALTPLRRSALDAVLRRFDVIDFNSAMAAAYGRIVDRHGFSRRKIIDRMIAATAITNGLTLITTNEADFREIDGLTLLIWPS
jgi:tRNA(fMet)-specific endonuclease VapC